MSAFEGTIYAKTLRMMTSLTVCLPGASKFEHTNAEMRVLYLLHGLSDNHSAWLRRTNIDRYAEEAGIAVVMPEVQRGFYSDMKYGLPYFSYITQELPALCRKMFRFSARREDTFVAGLSMGGYGAMKAALLCPQSYAAAASFSGAVDILKRVVGSNSHMLPEETFAITGGKLKDGDDLFYLSKQAALQDMPRFYITCGESDFMVDDNRAFHRHLEACGIPHKYEEWPGAHEWDFWDESIRRAVQFFCAEA